MSDQRAWVSMITNGGAAIIAVAYLIGVTVTTVRSRASIRRSTDVLAQQRIASAWAEWVTRARVAVYLALLVMFGFVLATTEDGWKGAWLPLLMLPLLRILLPLARRQDRRYAKLFLGVDLAADEPEV